MELELEQKISAVSVFPSDWTTKPLRLVGSFFKGKGIRKDEVKPSGLACVRYGELYTSYDNVITEFRSHINAESAQESQLIANGDILFAGSGEKREEIGKCATVICSDKVYAGGDIVILRPHKDDSVFLGYLLNSLPIAKQKSIQGQGDTVVHIYSSGLSKIDVALPPLHEQQAIAQVLSDTDKLIQSLEKKIAKKKLIKQGVMQQLLTPKEGWGTVILNDVMKVSRGGSPRPIQDFITSDPNGVNWIKIGDTSRLSKYIVSSKEKIIEAGVFNSRKVYKGDFLLSNSMSFGRPYILKIDGCIHDGWLVLQEYEKEFNIDFLYYTLTSKHTYNQYLSKAAGSGVLNLNKELVKTIELHKPTDIKEQERIATVLSNIDREIVHLEEERIKFQTLKEGMMQQLLTGKIRLV